MSARVEEPLDSASSAGKREVYLDNAATTKPRPEVVQVMMRELQNYGNPSSTHELGRRAKRVLEESRAVVAEALGAEPDEVFFTSGGTESNNLAVRGSVMARGVAAGRVITSALEHPSVTRSVRGLKREGDARVSYVEAVHGNFDLEACARFLQEPTTLVTVMAVQNELGYRLPIPEIVKLRNKYAPNALVHTDAVQAFGKIAVPVHEWGVDLVSLSAHKIGGPKGIGALFVKRGTQMFTNAFGGGQERGLRSAPSRCSSPRALPRRCGAPLPIGRRRRRVSGGCGTACATASPKRFPMRSSTRVRTVRPICSTSAFPA